MRRAEFERELPQNTTPSNKWRGGELVYACPTLHPKLHVLVLSTIERTTNTSRPKNTDAIRTLLAYWNGTRYAPVEWQKKILRAGGVEAIGTRVRERIRST